MKATICWMTGLIWAGIANAQSYCIPVTTAYCCNYGIVSVTLPGLSQPSANASVGYEDFSSLTAEAVEGQPLTLSLQTDGTEPHDVRIWLDADNDGTFAHPGEMVFEALNAIDPSGVMTLPAGTPVNTTLRLRIIADFAGSNPLPCQHPDKGQAEDYSFRLSAAGAVPVADFTVTAAHTCNGMVQFMQQATGNPTSYVWDFGDGHTSVLANPAHTYATDGTYSVSLTAANSQGSDTEQKNGYIHVAISETCDTFTVPGQGTASILYTYRFVVMDNGRTENYTNHTNGILSLSPMGAKKVCLHFSEFHFEEGFDFLEIYDGPTPASPLLGRYTGTGLPPAVCSSGPALCIKQLSDDVVTYSGFVAQTTVEMSVPEQPSAAWSLFPNPFGEQFQVMPPDYFSGAFTLRLTNLAGQTVWLRAFSDNPHAPVLITPSEIPAGLYVLHLESRDGMWQQKLLKHK